MREAAGRRQQLELEHEQALVVLNAKQQEIDLLQKAQVEAKKEHEGAVQLLENKVRELEERCRAQSEQFSLLSRDLEKFRQQAGRVDLLAGSPTAPGKPFPQFMNGLAASLGTGPESILGSHTVLGECARPFLLPVPGGSPEPLPATPAFPHSPRCRPEPGMDNDENSGPSRQRYSGKARLCVARYSYNPFDGPNENPEAELPLTAGKYLYVYGDMDEDGFYEGELLDGQRGLVPSNFVDFVQDSGTRLASTLAGEPEQNFVNHPGLDLHSPTLLEPSLPDSGTLDTSLADLGEDAVPYPRKITLIKQLAKSVIVGWEPPAVPPGWGAVSGYMVLVDQEPRLSLALGGRTKALVEKLSVAACTHRVSVQCVTSRGRSDQLQCTLLVGKDVVVAPSHLRVDNITQVSAQLSWVPTNSNYSHAIFLNEEELGVVQAARYKYQLVNLRPSTAYTVKVLARPHQVPWQLPLEQREKKEAAVEFCTLPAGPPAPPQDVTVQAGPTPTSVLVSWRPPALSATGLSNGADVTGYGVYAKGQRVAELMAPAAGSVAVELLRLRGLEAKAVSVRTLSAQGESEDSAPAAIPPDLLVPPPTHPRAAPPPQPSAGATGVPNTKDEHLGPQARVGGAWEPSRAPAPAHGHMLEPPGPGRRSPSPSRILPQPQGAPVSSSVAKAMAREAAQRVAESSRLEKRSLFLDRGAGRYANSDEEDAFESPGTQRRAVSVDEFLKGSELGKQPHCCHGDDHHTESSRGSDLSDIMEEDEEELYSEMQLEEGGRRRPSGTSHSALKDGTPLDQPECPPQAQHCAMLSSIPEVAEEDTEQREAWRPRGAGTRSRPCWGGAAARGARPLARSRAPGLHAEDCPLEDWGGRCSRLATRSPDSGLDCGSEEEEPRVHVRSPRQPQALRAASRGPAGPRQPEPCPCRRCLRPLLARRRTLTRQNSVEGDFGELVDPRDGIWSDEPPPSPERSGKACWEQLPGQECPAAWRRGPAPSALRDPAQLSARAAGGPWILGTPMAAGRADRAEHAGRTLPRSSAGPQRARPGKGPAIDDSSGRDLLSPDFYEGSETDPGAEELPARVFVALFDYDPLTMSPNPDAAEEELPFKEGQIIKVYGDKDADGFYRGETCARLGLIPCNMVSEIQADDEEMMAQLLRQGFLPLSTPVGKPERSRGGRRPSVSTRRMVALYDYDPRESSPNVDVEAELTFCTGDIITVFGEIDEDGFYYGELNGQKGLVPSNFLEEVPDDVEVYLSDAPSHYSQDTPLRPKAKREPPILHSRHTCQFGYEWREVASRQPRRAAEPSARLGF
ncbi:RIMS-binding protein 2 isoform X1 [Sorex araneus]|uniref:RIMS-binding protein 2 isoform X1 n=1 Tax=Sorex araneus TaxID=42254 RepID=UPI0024337577|nr:RIMS-binding protein 2 isoform X1 [Sorex araneus]